MLRCQRFGGLLCAAYLLIGCDSGRRETEAKPDSRVPPAPASRRVTYRGGAVRVVDMHLHTGRWDLLPPGMQETIRQSFPPPLQRDAENLVNASLSSKGIAGQLEEANIDRGVLFAVYAPKTTGVAPNRLVAERVESVPERFYALASAPVDDWANQQGKALEELEAYLRRPAFIGVKMAHPHMQIRFDDRAYDGIYRVAQRVGVPVFIHTGKTPMMDSLNIPEANDPRFLEPVITEFADVDFVLGHVGYDSVAKSLGYLDSCLSLAKQHRNVYLEASALGSAFSDPTGKNLTRVLQSVKEAGLIDRLMYGSDGPQRPGFVADYLERTLKAMEAADFTVAEAKRFLAGTFEVVFDVGNR